MKVRVMKNAWFLVLGTGMYLHPWILIKGGRTENRMRVTFRHELQHVYQAKRLGGPLKFYWQYFKDLLKYRSMRDSPLETEAYAKAWTKLTERERDWYEKGIVEL